MTISFRPERRLRGNSSGTISVMDAEGEVIARVDRVDAGGRRGVAARVVALRRIGCPAGDESAHLERVLAQRLGADRVERVAVELQHAPHATGAGEGRAPPVRPAGSVGSVMAAKKAKKQRGAPPGTTPIATQRAARPT